MTQDVPRDVPPAGQSIENLRHLRASTEADLRGRISGLVSADLEDMAMLISRSTDPLDQVIRKVLEGFLER